MLTIAPPAGAHALHGALRAQELAANVDVVDAVKLLGRRLQERLLERDAGVVDQDVHAAQRRRSRVHQPVAVIHQPQVGAHRLGAHAHRSRLRHRALGACGAARVVHTTSAPWRANSSATSRPIPVPAPVTNAFFPASRPVICLPRSSVATQRCRRSPICPLQSPPDSIVVLARSAYIHHSCCRRAPAQFCCGRSGITYLLTHVTGGSTYPCSGTHQYAARPAPARGAA